MAKSDHWEPEWLHGVFAGILRSSNIACAEPYAVTGDWSVEPGDAEEQYVHWLKVHTIEPPLMPVDLPSACPDDVSARLREATLIMLIDPSAAANRARVGVETLLTHLGVAKFRRTGPRTPISAHRRIGELATTKPDVAELLYAVKWIGNTGAHAANLTLADFLDGFEIMAHALELIYNPRPAQLRKRAQAINKAKGVGKRKAP